MPLHEKVLYFNLDHSPVRNSDKSSKYQIHFKPYFGDRSMHMAKPSMLRVDSLEYLKSDMTENSTAKMVRKQSRIKTLVMGNIKEEPLLIKGRQDLVIGIHELGRQLEWLRSNKRARNEARKLYRLRTFSSKMDTAENFCLRSAVMLVLLFAIIYVIRAISIFLLPELFLECSASHPSMHLSNYSAWPSSSADASISGLRLRWMLFRGRHPCVPIYMECFTLHDSITLPYQGQY